MKTQESIDHDDDNHQIILDDLISSQLLTMKIRDIPSSEKYKTIVEPIENRSIHSYNFDSVKNGVFMMESCLQTCCMNLNLEPLTEYLSYLNLWNNKKLIMMIIKHFEHLLEFVSEELKNDREIVLLAIENTGSMLKFASDSLRNDREIIMKAIEKDCFAIQFASDELRNDKEIVWKAIKKNSYLLTYASNELKSDREFMLSLIENDSDSSDELKNDTEFLLESIRRG